MTGAALLAGEKSPPWNCSVFVLPAMAVVLDVAYAGAVAYADGLDIERAVVGIGLSCRLCNRQNCRSRGFPPLEHRLALDPALAGGSLYRFLPRA